MRNSPTTRITRVARRFISLIAAAALFPLRVAEGIQSMPSSPVEISVDTSKIINTMRGGIGASWHAIEQPIPIGHGGSGRGAYPPAEDEHAWQQIYRHASWLGLDWNRVEIEQRIYAALGVTKSLVVPIDGDGDDAVDGPIDFEAEAAAITIADERAA